MVLSSHFLLGFFTDNNSFSVSHTFYLNVTSVVPSKQLGVTPRVFSFCQNMRRKIKLKNKVVSKQLLNMTTVTTIFIFLTMIAIYDCYIF